MLPIEEMKQYIKNHLEKSIEDFFKLVRIPTVTAKKGGYSHQAIDELKRIFNLLNFETKIVQTKGEPVFTAYYDSGKPKTILFYDHYDVQPAEPFELWDSDPFEPEIRDNRIYGRGVADNKGEIIVRASAIKMLKDLTGDLPVNVKFVIEGEEEVSSPNLSDFISQNLDFIKADGCIWEFGGKNASGLQEIWAGLKGICYVQLKTIGPTKDLHSSLAAIIENPANHLVAALASLRNDKTDKILLENYYNSIIKPSNEFYEEVSKIADKFDEEKQKESWGVEKFALDLHGKELLEKFYLSPTCTICGIWSGWQGSGGKTVLPSEAHAKLDFRLVPNQTPEEVIQKLKAHFSKHQFNVEIEWYEGYRPAYTPLDSPFVQLLSSVMKEVYNHEPLVHPWNPGSGPLYLFSDHLPVLSIGVGNAGSNAHSPNENIEVNDFKLGQVCIARLMEKMAVE